MWPAVGAPEAESSDCDCGNEELHIQPLELFRRKAGIVRVLCRVGLAFSLVAREAGVAAGAAQQLREDQPTVLKFYSDADSGYLEFDAGDYRFNSDEEYRWPSSAKAAVLKMPRYRGPDEAASVLVLMRQLRFCRRLAPDVQRKMAEQAYYMRLEKGRDVLKAGHTGYSFYVIFSGQVRVSANLDLSAEPVLLKKGDSFGEGALLFETTRNLTVTTEKLTEFLIVYDDCFFDSGLADHFVEQYRRIEHFLRSLVLFSSLSTGTLASLSRHCSLLEHQDGSVIVQDSLRTQFAWFVVSGSADCFGRVAQAERRLDAADWQRLGWLASVDARIPEISPGLRRPQTASSRAPFVLPGELPCRYLVKVGHLTAGKSFGLSSMFDQSRAFSLVSRGCEVLALSRQTLLDHVPRRHLESAHLLYESVPSDRRMQRRCELQCDWMLYRRREMRATVHRLQEMSDRFDKTHPMSHPNPQLLPHPLPHPPPHPPLHPNPPPALPNNASSRSKRRSRKVTTKAQSQPQPIDASQPSVTQAGRVSGAPCGRLRGRSLSAKPRAS